MSEVETVPSPPIKRARSGSDEPTSSTAVDSSDVVDEAPVRVVRIGDDEEDEEGTAAQDGSPEAATAASAPEPLAKASSSSSSVTSTSKTVLNTLPVTLPSTSNEAKVRRVPGKPIRDLGKFHLLIGVTGSVAAIKVAELVQSLFAQCKEGKLSIKVIATQAAMHFLRKYDLDVDLYLDEDEWSMWQNRGDPVLHIGLCDNLLTCIVRAWDTKKPLYFAPAMNTYMWTSAHTVRHRKALKDLLSFKEIPPIAKELICGDEGMGAMATVKTIVSVVAADVDRRFAVYSDSTGRY